MWVSEHSVLVLGRLARSSSSRCLLGRQRRTCGQMLAASDWEQYSIFLYQKNQISDPLGCCTPWVQKEQGNQLQFDHEDMTAAAPPLVREDRGPHQLACISAFVMVVMIFRLQCQNYGTICSNVSCDVVDLISCNALSGALDALSCFLFALLFLTENT